MLGLIFGILLFLRELLRLRTPWIGSSGVRLFRPHPAPRAFGPEYRAIQSLPQDSLLCFSPCPASLRIAKFVKR
ncbi:hypothetical protein BDV18DRAFT_149651 [Aspergillus unguis]